MKAPPLLPEEALHRVLRVANLDGLTVMGIAGFLALISAAAGDYQGAGVGLLVTAAGAIELHGMGLLRAGEKRGMNWVIASQPYLFLVLAIYCAERILDYDPVAMRTQVNFALSWWSGGTNSNELQQVVASEGVLTDQSLRLNYLIGYGLLIVGTLIFQGRMTVFYWQRRAAVAAALADEEEETE